MMARRINVRLTSSSGWRSLNQGEAVHSPQRALHHGLITAKRGRTTEQLGAISGALTLLANIVMAWNTHRLQSVLDRALAAYPDAALRRITPIGHQRINPRGILTFDLTRLGRTGFASRSAASGTKS
jgi:hypothetical protein